MEAALSLVYGSSPWFIFACSLLISFAQPHACPAWPWLLQYVGVKTTKQGPTGQVCVGGQTGNM